jgi:hypothetical protein
MNPFRPIVFRAAVLGTSRVNLATVWPKTPGGIPRCCGSSSAIFVERVLAGVEPHLMVTDPPYGVNYDPAWRNRAADP